MNKNIKNILYVTLGIIGIAILSGIYRFNFTDNDIFVEQNGKIVPISDIQKKELNIVTSIVPLASIANNIGGEYVEVSSLIPVGVSPHTFDLTPKQMLNINDSDIIIHIGLEHIDGFLEKAIGDKNDLAVSEGITLIDSKPGGHEDHHHHEHEKDPHIWTSPNNAIFIAEKIKNELSVLDPENKMYYENNYNNFVEEIKTIISEFKSEISGKEMKKFIIFHDAYNYLFQYLGIPQDKKIIFQESVIGDQNAKEMKVLVDSINKYQIDVLFKEPQFQTPYLNEFAGKHSLQLLNLDPLGNDISTNGYINNLKNNINNLKYIYE